MVDRDVGRQVAEARRAAGLTQRELAAAVGCHISHLGKVEIGYSRASAGLLARLCGVLGAVIRIGGGDG